MAKRGFLRRLTDKITQPVKKVVQRVTSPTKKKPAPKKTTARKSEPKTRPTPAIAREMLMTKMDDMHGLQKKYDAAATSRRITRMTDTQVYMALDMSDDELETAVRKDPKVETRWASPDDPTINVLYYQGGVN